MANPENHYFGPSEQAVELIPSVAVPYIKERNAAEAALERAKIDPVTGLPNRQAFEEKYPRYFRESPNNTLVNEMSVMVVDLNGLKRVNTAYGHEGGDKYLKAVAESLRKSLRAGDDIFRTGGDEIVVILPNKMPESTSVKESNESVRERIKAEALTAAIGAGISGDLYPGVSVGYAVRREGDTPDRLLQMADLASESDKRDFYAHIMRETGMDLRR